MARKIVTHLEDDRDGGKAAETVTFGLDGVAYEIDLNSKNAARLRKTLDPYVAVARRAKRVPPRSRGRAPVGRVSVQADSATVRQWAAANGISVARRGRIPSEVIEQFHAAGN